MKRVVFFSVMLSLLALSCGKDEKPLPKDGYEIVTLSAIDITTNKATLTGKFRAGAQYNKVEDGGDFYALGELGPKDNYTLNTYLPAVASISEDLDVSTDIATISLGGT